jgi:hypothetical protein
MALVALASMVLVMGLLAGLLYLIRDLPIETSIVNAAALSALLLVLTGVLALLQLISPTATAGIGALALLGLVVGELAVILGLMSYFDVNPSIEVAAALSLLLISMSASLVLLGVVGAMGPAAFIGVAALATLIAGIGGLIVGIGALVEKFPMLDTFLNTGIPIIEKIGYAIGSFFGNIVGGFLGNLTSGLPDMATDLSNFMTNLQPFIEGAKNIDASVIAGVGFLSGAIIALSVADLIQGITSFLQFGSSLSELGTELSLFMMNALPFITTAQMITPEMLTGVKTLSEVILILTAANILEGLTSWFTGGSSLTSFGEQLPLLGTYISQFAANLGEFGPEQIMSVTSAAMAIKALAQAANEIPNEGGWAAKIFGENSIATFGSYLPGLASNLNSFATNLGEFDDSKIATISCAAEAIKIIAGAAESLPNEGGWAAKILGENSIATFGSYLPGLASNLNSFATNLGTFSEEQVTTVTCAANAIKALAQAANEIPNEGGLWASIVGDNSLATFSGYLPSLGTNIASFVTNLGTFTPEQVTTVQCAADAIRALADVAGSLPDGQAEWAKKLFGDNGIAAFSGQFPTLGTNLKNFAVNLGTFTDAQVSTVRAAVSAINAFADLADTDLKAAKSNITGFGDKLPSLGSDIKSFVSNMPSTDSLSSAISNLKKVRTTIDDLSGADADIAAKFTNSLKNIGKDGVSAFVNAFTSDTANTDATAAGKKLMDKVPSGAKEREDNAKKVFKSIASACATAIGDKWQSFYDAGKNLVEGFASGISENDYIATAKAAAMAKAAAESAEAELDINSPSKVFRKIGYSVPEGFAQGIERMTGLVKVSVAGMTDGAVSSVGRSISRIADAINSDIDAQPTIRPVLDLSDVREGAGSINGLFDTEARIGVLSRVGTISSSMNRINQNGNSSDIVSAINRLHKDLNTAKGDTYIIDGVTYDDGSNVADAVKAITRYAKIERRM